MPTYTQQTWTDNSITNPAGPISAARLTHIEAGIGSMAAATPDWHIIDPAQASTAGTAINTAIAALPSLGGTLFLGAGTWTLDTAILINKSGVILQGASNGSTLLQFNGSTITTAIKMADTTQRWGGIKDLRFISTVDAAGTVIDGSYFTNWVIERLRIGSSGASPNKGIIFNALGSYYNMVRDVRIQVAGAGSQGMAFTTTSNSNMVFNARIIGDTQTTGVLVDSHAIEMNHIDIESNCLIGIDVAANGNDCLIAHPYIEATPGTGVRIASGVEAPTILSGFIADNTTANITDNGSVGFNVVNTRLQYDPYTRIGFVGAASVDGPSITSGAGAPAFVAPKGSIYLRNNGGANTSLYVNETGTSTWAAK